MATLRDIFKREVQVGDKVLIVNESKRNTLRLLTVHNVREDVLNGIYKGEFIILEDKDGTEFYTHSGNPLNYFFNVYTDEYPFT